MAVCKVHCIVCYVVFASQIQSHTHIPSAIPSNSSSAAKQSKNEWMRNDASVWVYILLLLCFYLHCMCLCLFLCIQITTLWCVDFYLRFSNFFFIVVPLFRYHVNICCLRVWATSNIFLGQQHCLCTKYTLQILILMCLFIFFLCILMQHTR